MSGTKSKRDLVLELANGGVARDTVPAAFFLHFPEQYRRGDAAVRKHEEFFRATDMDIVKIQFELPFPSAPIAKPEDWAKVPFLDKAFFEPQLAVVKGLVDALKSEALVVCTLYSPYMIANHFADAATLAKHLALDPEPVVKGIEITRDGLMGFVRDAVAAGLDGFYHSTQGGEDRRFADRSLFEKWIKPIDLEVMREIDRICLFDILHICDYHRDEVGGYASLAPFLHYPGHLVNVEPPGTAQEVVDQFDRPFMGGLERRGVLATGSPEDVRKAARSVLDAAPDRFLLAADCTVPPDTPWANLRAAVDEAHKGR